MLGNETIAKILKNEYGLNDLTPYEEIDYQIEQYTDEISRVKITLKTDRCFCCPVYAMFDYDIGKKAPSRFFIILYMLSVVAAKETKRLQQEGENNNE